MVPDRRDAHDLLSRAVTERATELDSFHHFDLVATDNPSIAEVLGLLQLQRAELKILLLAVSLAEKELAIAAFVAADILALEVGNLGVLQI